MYKAGTFVRQAPQGRLGGMTRKPARRVRRGPSSRFQIYPSLAKRLREVRMTVTVPGRARQTVLVLDKSYAQAAQIGRVGGLGMGSAQQGSQAARA